MTGFPDDEVEELKRCHPNVAIAEEGGIAFLRFEELKLPEGCQPASVAALLCPSDHSGYTSRLFLACKVQHKGKGTNWNADGLVILGQRWWAASWKIDAGNRRLLSKLQAHLAAFGQ